MQQDTAIADPEAWVLGQLAPRLTDQEIIEHLIESGRSLQEAYGVLNAARDKMRLRDRLQALLAKNATWVAQTFRDLQRPAGKRAAMIAETSEVDRRAFWERYYSRNEPVVFRGIARGSAAMEWTPERFVERFGGCEIEVMRGRSGNAEWEINADALKTRMTVSAFKDLIDSVESSNDFYLVANNDASRRPPFDALLAEMPRLEPLLRYDLPNKPFLWWGPRGTVTPLHYDTVNNLLVQIYGRKQVILHPSTATRWMYNYRSVFSLVDAEHPDIVRHQEYAHAERFVVVLEPGDGMFIPVGWWHHVRALDPSVSISCDNFVFRNYYDFELGRT